MQFSSTCSCLRSVRRRQELLLSLLRSSASTFSSSVFALMTSFSRPTCLTHIIAFPDGATIYAISRPNRLPSHLVVLHSSFVRICISQPYIGSYLARDPEPRFQADRNPLRLYLTTVISTASRCLLSKCLAKNTKKLAAVFLRKSPVSHFIYAVSSHNAQTGQGKETIVSAMHK